MKREVSARLSGRVERAKSLPQARGGAERTKTNDSAAPQSFLTRRITPARLVTITEQLDDRDVAVLATVAKLRAVTGAQLRRVHFRGIPSADRQARRVLAKLVDLQILTALDRRVGGVRAGSEGKVYALGLAGQRLAGGRGPAGGVRIERAWTPGPLYLRHRLTIGELLVVLSEAEARGELELIEFSAEPGCWRNYSGPAGEIVTYKPDAFVRLGVGPDEHLAFVEVDCDTEGPRALDRKLDLFRQFVALGDERQRWGVLPLLVWLVPTTQRAAVVEAACRRQPSELHDVFRVAVIEQAVSVLTGGSHD